jgi:outer membrane protein
MVAFPPIAKRSHLVAWVFGSLALAASNSVWAQSSSVAESSQSPAISVGREWSGRVGVGVLSIPEYEGASQMAPVPLIAGEARWGDRRYIAVEGPSGRMNLLDQSGLEFGPAFNITFGRDKNIDSKKVRLLGEIDDAVELGAFVAYEIGSTMREGDTIRLAGEVLADATDVHGGVLADVSATYTASIGERWRVSSSASLSFVSDEYADTYFSVTPKGAALSGLKATKVESGAKDFSLSANVSYGLNDRWALFGLVGYSRLLGDFADSPIVAVEGDENQFSAGIGVGWRF